MGIVQVFPFKPTVIVYTGGGIQPYWLFKECWDFDSDKERKKAKTLSKAFQKYLQNIALDRGWAMDGTADLCRLLRLPGTYNRKQAEPVLVRYEVIGDGHRYNPSDFEDFLNVEADPELKAHVQGPAPEQPTAEFLRVLAGCPWIRHCKDDAASLPEPEWYRMLSIVGRCKDGIHLAHELSRPYPKYSEIETSEKLKQATGAAGPAIAAMLTPVVRPATKGPTPLALFDATTQGTGKSLLSEVVSIITIGREAPMFSAARDAEEWRKVLTSVLREGSAVVVIDNVTYRLDNGDFCKALTETTHGDRILGKSETVNFPVRCAWIATGNNIQLGGDMPRRCYWIRMDAKCSKPFQRTGFKHKRLKEYVLKHRGELLAALLTLARAWFVAGRPEPRLTPVGGFEDWSVIVGGILQHAGIEGFLGNSNELYEQADIESIQWEAFLKMLDTVFYSEPFTVAQVWERMNDKTWNESTRQSQVTERAEGLRAALPDFIAQAMDREGFFKQRLGFAFSEHLGRRYGDSQVRIERDVHDRHEKVARWKVVRNG